ncbi:hypothetical protein HRG84_24390 [Flavisolibacter sp. BT320]|nr:hypothetical protein [Flavisolibacter longurius]
MSPDSYVKFEFKDFNRDGYKDLFLEWGGNLPERYSLYLFVPVYASFKEVKHFSDFPAATPIKGTGYYYSYYRNGCADNAWGSDLFQIQNYKAIKIGRIKGEGCGIENGIYIHRVKAGKTTLTETLPLQTINAYKERKFGFIHQYWTKKYRQFI